MTTSRPRGWRTTTRRCVVEGSDRALAVLAHASIGFGIVIGVGFITGIIINALVWLRSRHSPFVAMHAEQAGSYQVFVLVTTVLMAAGLVGAAWSTLSGLLFEEAQVVVPIGVSGVAVLVLLPLLVLWYFGTILLGLYGALRVAAGKPFSYPVFGAWARRHLPDVR
ncbi:MAG: DUF4870 domain-containing protein [Chloroflexi bacterium]|nr:DUF4870 domain-containing protein [Chloroflexota bacterium]